MALADAVVLDDTKSDRASCEQCSTETDERAWLSRERWSLERKLRPDRLIRSKERTTAVAEDPVDRPEGASLPVAWRRAILRLR